MSGQIINDLRLETEAAEREYNYWKKEAAFLNAKAETEKCAIAAIVLRTEAARCEQFAEDVLNFLEHLRLATKNAEEVL